MNATRTIALCAQLETKLDTVLFRRMEDEQPVEGGSLTGTVAKGAAGAGIGHYAGSAIKRGLAPLVGDRRSGMRATVDGFRDASPIMQNVRATGSVLGNNPLKSASAVAGTIAADARALKRGLGSGLRAVTKGRFGFQSLPQQVIEFAKQMDDCDGDADGSKKKTAMKKKFIAKRK